jgi:hypothetical protein
MAGTQIGGLRARDTNLKKYGKDFYRKAGSKGGKVSRGGGFAYGEQGKKLAQIAGSLGGKKSRRGASKLYECNGEMLSILDISVALGITRGAVRARIAKYGNVYGTQD